MDPVIHVVGGGIGGLSVALALHRRGIEVEVHEAAAAYRRVGGGHWLYANSLQALDRIDPGLGEAVAAHGHRFDAFRFGTAAGRTLLHEPAAPYAPRPELAPAVVHRADLLDELVRRLPPGQLHLGRRLIRAEPGRLTFDDGRTVQAPLVLGADGIHSRVRADRLQLPAPRFSGQTGLWGLCDLTLPGNPASEFTELWGNGVRMGFTYIGTGQVYWFLVVRDPVPADLDPSAVHALCSHHSRAFPDLLQRAVAATAPRAIHVNPLYDLWPRGRWYTDDACCLGDAVHACTPNLGQGGGQAIEDALALADALTNAAPRVAFARFQRARAFRAVSVVALSRWLGQLAQARGAMGRLRTLAVAATPAWVLRPVLRRLMAPPA